MCNREGIPNPNIAILSVQNGANELNMQRHTTNEKPDQDTRSTNETRVKDRGDALKLVVLKFHKQTK
jgi:hypothetical protein